MKKGLDAYKLKIIALVFMLLDHVKTYLSYPTYEYLGWPRWPEFIGMITRFVSPLFLYLMIEGFYHTRSRKKYLIRLFVAGLIMMAGNVTINYLFLNTNGQAEEISFHSLTQGHDVFLTLGFCFAIVWCLENLKTRKKILLNGFLLVICALSVMFNEGGLFLLPITVIIYFLRKKKTTMCLGILVFCLLLLLKALVGYNPAVVDSFYAYMCFDDQWAMAAVIPFILLYNGERGKNTPFTKYMFYVIYPVHLWILMIARYMIMP
ncbi:MAG: hypothetical protein J5476_15355 [Lachnospiraceae bacterium]|nr:hypothetical protein [Lachnospiraceae bacterium]